jgi:carbohydrate-selective porin OprB
MIEEDPNRHLRFRSVVQSITEGNPSNPAISGSYNLTNNPSGTSLAMRDGVVWNNEVAYLYGSGKAHFGVSYSGARAFTEWQGNASNGTLFTIPGFQASSSPGNSEEYWILKQTVYRPTPGSDRSVDLVGTFVYSPDDKGFLPYNRQLVLTSEFNGFIPRRSKDSINFAFDYLGIRGPLQTPTFQSEKVYELDYSFQINKWLKWTPDLQFHQDIDANPRNGTGMFCSSSLARIQEISGPSGCQPSCGSRGAYRDGQLCYPQNPSHSQMVCTPAQVSPALHANPCFLAEPD